MNLEGLRLMLELRGRVVNVEVEVGVEMEVDVEVDARDRVMTSMVEHRDEILGRPQGLSFSDLAGAE